MNSLEYRYLIIEGRASADSLKMVPDGLLERAKPHAIWCFLSYSYGDVPLSTEFTHLFPSNNIAHMIQVRCRIEVVTQEWGKPFGLIPRGWKTLAALEFVDAAPDLVRRMPVRNTWNEGNLEEYICLSDEETWQTLLRYGKTNIWESNGTTG